jgi:hypothetical protein
MQLERSYFRLLKVEYKFNELIFIARHAYCSIDLAVKTSRPQKKKERVFLVECEIR